MTTTKLTETYEQLLEKEWKKPIKKVEKNNTPRWIGWIGHKSNFDLLKEMLERRKSTKTAASIIHSIGYSPPSPQSPPKYNPPKPTKNHFLK